jgi:hypothetical protein
MSCELTCNKTVNGADAAHLGTCCPDGSLPYELIRGI